MPRSAPYHWGFCSKEVGRSTTTRPHDLVRAATKAENASKRTKAGGRRMGPRIAIVGTGAVGGYAGAHMARAGEDVTFVDFWPENVETIRDRGLRISHLRGVP